MTPSIKQITKTDWDMTNILKSKYWELCKIMDVTEKNKAAAKAAQQKKSGKGA